MVVNNNKSLINRKEWQMMTPSPAASVAWAFIASPGSWNWNISLYVTSATVQYMYHHDEDWFIQIPSWALAWTFWAGACGVYHPWSINYTATGWSTTSVTINSATYNINWLAKWAVIEFLTSWMANYWLRRTVTDINTSWWWTWTITLILDVALPTSVLNTNVFRMNTGRFYVMWAGTVASWIFKVLDCATLSWQASLATTNLPAAWGTDWKIILPYDYWEIQATGTATVWWASTITNWTKTWTVNQWTNYQIRITWWTWIWQVRQIASNTSTAITVWTAWTIQPDATSTYEITASEDYLYLLGNNAITMYRYSISANTWTVMSPTIARAWAPIAWMSWNAIWKSWESIWENESIILDGRYIYSFRWWTSVLDRFDIAWWTAWAGAWQVITYVWAETFSGWSSVFSMWRYLYIKKDATNRFFKYSIRWNYIEPISTDFFPDSTAVIWQKIWVKNYDSSSWISWIYSLQNSGTVLRRLMIF